MKKWFFINHQGLKQRFALFEMQIYFSLFPSQAGSDGSLLTEIPAAVGATLGSSLDWSAPKIHHVPVSKSIVSMGF